MLSIVTSYFIREVSERAKLSRSSQKILCNFAICKDNQYCSQLNYFILNSSYLEDNYVLYFLVYACILFAFLFV